MLRVWASKHRRWSSGFTAVSFANGGCCLHNPTEGPHSVPCFIWLTRVPFPPDLTCPFLAWCRCSVGGAPTSQVTSGAVFSHMSFPGNFPGGCGWMGDREAERLEVRTQALQTCLGMGFWVMVCVHAVPPSAFLLHPTEILA